MQLACQICFSFVLFLDQMTSCHWYWKLLAFICGTCQQFVAVILGYPEYCSNNTGLREERVKVLRFCLPFFSLVHLCPYCKPDTEGIPWKKAVVSGGKGQREVVGTFLWCVYGNIWIIVISGSKISIHRFILLLLSELSAIKNLFYSSSRNIWIYM